MRGSWAGTKARRPSSGLRSRQECSPRAGLGQGSAAHAACIPQGCPLPMPPPSRHDTRHTHVPPCNTPDQPWHLHLVPGAPPLLGGRESPASRPGPESPEALSLLELHVDPWRNKTQHVTAGLANKRDSQCLGLPCPRAGTPETAHRLLPRLCTPGLWHEATLGEHPTTLLREHPWGTDNGAI